MSHAAREQRDEPQAIAHVNLRRDITADAINIVLNDPEVRPDLLDFDQNPDVPLDLTAAVANTNNVLLVGEFGGIFSIKTQVGIYEPHTAVLRSARGPWVEALGWDYLHWMFCRTDCVELITRCPREHRGGIRFMIEHGFSLDFSVPDGCTWRGKVQPCDIYSLRIQEWARLAPNLEWIGHDFHERLNAKVAAMGIADQPHADDPIHNRWVGLAYEMALHGQALKGVALYNRAAIAMRRRTAQVTALDPVIIRFNDDEVSTLIIHPNGDFEVAR